MTSSSYALYQGRDWVSGRASMADAFDTVERLHDLCVGRDYCQSAELMVETFAVLKTVHGLIENLSSQCALAMADTIPLTAPVGSFAQSWNCFEIEGLLRSIKSKRADLSNEQQTKPFGALALLAVQLKASLKKLDQ